VDVLIQDASQTLIDVVVRVAVEGTDRIAREYARNRLHQDVHQIISLAAFDYVLLQVEQQVSQYGQPSDFLLEDLGKCLMGLSTENKGLPPDVARRALAMLWQILTQARPTDDCFVPLLAAMGFPEFRQVAGELERRLATTTDEMAKVRILETLIAMRAPSLPNVVFRHAMSDRSPALQARTTEWIVEHAGPATLSQFPNALKPVAYHVAIQKGIRLVRSGLRHRVILANGVLYGGPTD
jgi:hypothetical protein